VTDPAQSQSDYYLAAWKALTRRERLELTAAAMRGLRPANRWDAAITLWWTQRELRYGLRNSLLGVGILAVVLVLLEWALTGTPPTNPGEMLRRNPMLPVFFLIPIAAGTVRRPKLRRSAQVNAAALTGKQVDSPPDAEETERLLTRARKQGWFKAARPKR
jgi:hypothetical protein